MPRESTRGVTSRPVPSPALPCPRARAVGTSQPAAELLLHVPAHAAQHGTALPAPRQAMLSRDDYKTKTQGDGLHPHIQHLRDPGAMSAQAVTPTASGTPGLAAATCRQVTPTPPVPPPCPEPRGQGSTGQSSGVGSLRWHKPTKAMANLSSEQSPAVAAGPPGHRAFLPKGMKRRRGKAPAVQSWFLVPMEVARLCRPPHGAHNSRLHGYGWP